MKTSKSSLFRSLYDDSSFLNVYSCLSEEEVYVTLKKISKFTNNDFENIQSENLSWSTTHLHWKKNISKLKNIIDETVS